MSRRKPDRPAHPPKENAATPAVSPSSDIDSSILRIPIVNRSQKRSPTSIIAELQANWVASTVRLREIIDHGFPRATVYKLLSHGCANADVVTLVHVGAILGWRLHWIPLHPEEQRRLVAQFDHARKMRDERMTERLERAKRKVDADAQKPAKRRRSGGKALERKKP